MSAPEAMTYDSLASDVQLYAERDDAKFTNQISRFIMLAENRIASEVRSLGTLLFVNGVLPINNPVLPKPSRWRETRSFSIVVGSQVQYLLPRPYDYCRVFWPNTGLTDVPSYYADYDYEHFFIAATPAEAYQFELAYYERPQPLSTSNQTSWTTRYAPQLLLYAALLEAQPFLKNSERIAEFQALYTRAGTALANEDQRRVATPATGG